MDFLAFYGENASITIGIVNTINNLIVVVKFYEEILNIIEKLFQSDENSASLKLHATCPYCKEEIEFRSEFCPNCGTEFPTCVICWGIEKPGEIMIQLDCCLRYAHKNHIDNWKTNHSSCPSCFSPKFKYTIL